MGAKNSSFEYPFQDNYLDVRSSLQQRPNDASGFESTELVEKKYAIDHSFVSSHRPGSTTAECSTSSGADMPISAAADGAVVGGKENVSSHFDYGPVKLGLQMPKRLLGDSFSSISQSVRSQEDSIIEENRQKNHIEAAGTALQVSPVQEKKKNSTPYQAQQCRREQQAEESTQMVSKKQLLAQSNHKSFLSPPAIDFFLQYLFGGDLINCLSCCPHWFIKIMEWLDEYCKNITKNFQDCYSGYLEINSSTIKFQPIYTAEKSVRLDWVIFARVTSRCEKRTNTIGYSFIYNEVSKHHDIISYTSDLPDEAMPPEKKFDENFSISNRRGGQTSKRSQRNKLQKGRPNVKSLPQLNSTSIFAPSNSFLLSTTSKKYHYDVLYTFDTYPKNTSRSIWVHKDLRRFHGDETQVASTSSVQITCTDDRVEVAVNLCNAFGICDVSSIRWYPLEQVENPPTRICYVEREYSEWFNFQQFRTMSGTRARQPEDFPPCLKHICTDYAGYDSAVRRSVYKAVAPGSISERVQRMWGAAWEVFPRDHPIVCPLVRTGLLHDRFLSVQIRVGDTVKYFLSQGGP
ncbi:hypothetical protein IE077_003256 [Cardiosporidium cionae]|uniref:Uncharacterized protein n=1 Tax=Cardiosporidium cionae TaxID=476202 RepID=A0ABQ7J8R5_9APIC|nr:hypothetical protein IE077_003256 [Cardiosporidium cionae]|eukprot:KAF8820366.1 hypothetical protein IE077_003256 [Cardiosporidium cionae]